MNITDMLIVFYMHVFTHIVLEALIVTFDTIVIGHVLLLIFTCLSHTSVHLV